MINLNNNNNNNSNEYITHLINAQSNVMKLNLKFAKIIKKQKGNVDVHYQKIYVLSNHITDIISNDLNEPINGGAAKLHFGQNEKDLISKELISTVKYLIKSDNALDDSLKEKISKLGSKIEKQLQFSDNKAQINEDNEQSDITGFSDVNSSVIDLNAQYSYSQNHLSLINPINKRSETRSLSPKTNAAHRVDAAEINIDRLESTDGFSSYIRKNFHSFDLILFE